MKREGLLFLFKQIKSIKMRKIILSVFFVTQMFMFNAYSGSLLPTLGISPSGSLATDRARVTIGDVKGAGSTVLTADGEVLRGNAIWLWRAKLLNNPAVLEYAFEEEYYQALADSGVNFVRLCIYTQANDWGGGTNYHNAAEVEFLLERTDSVVNFASKYGMYVMINYHDVGDYMGEYGNPDATTMGYLKDFWDVFAPYYKNRTHVFYELVNEPAFGCSNFTDDLLNDMDEIYNYVQPMVPETHLSLLCITGAVGKSWDNRTMDQVVDRYLQLHPNSVDWSNASIAFHPYVNTDKIYSSDPIVNVMKDYPVINSEANYPCDPSIHDQVVDADKQCQTVDGELFINQTMERLGISWNMHKSLGWNYFNNNWPLLLQDARDKGYIWFSTDGGGPDGNVVAIQAEDEDAKSGVAESTHHSGYNGSGYLDYGSSGTWAEWTYNANSAGTVTLDVRYALSSGSRPCEVTVDGVSAGSLAFSATGSWSTWQYNSLDIEVDAGANVIRITASPGSGPNIDELKFTSSESCTAPSISSNPSDAIKTEGETATFSVSATGSSLSYQWKKDGSNISGANSSSYTTPSLTLSDDGSTYSCYISNSCGNVTSNTATLTVEAACTLPSISSHPSDVTKTEGATATFSVTAAGSDLNYQWRKDGSNISGANSSSYTTPSLTLSDDGSTYSCYVSNSCGNETSNSATLTVTEQGNEAWYDLTPTYYVNNFTGTTLNSQDFTWHADGSGWTGISFASSDELVVSNAGKAWHKITHTFADGVSLDISGNPIVSFKAKTTASSNLSYELRLEDSNGNNTYSNYAVTLIGDGQYHEYDVTVGPAYQFDPSILKEVQLYYGDQADVPCEIYIDNFELGGDLKSAPSSGIQAGNDASKLKVYPNPVVANVPVTIELIGFENNIETELYIADVAGRVVFRTFVPTNDQNSVKQMIDVDMLTSGLYMISVKSGNEIINKKMIIR
jgi:hypothetical protein